MPPNQVGNNMASGKTGKFVKKGHTSGAYGNEVNTKARGEAGGSPRELNP